MTRKSGLLGRKINISSSCKSRHHMGHENAPRLAVQCIYFILKILLLSQSFFQVLLWQDLKTYHFTNVRISFVCRMTRLFSRCRMTRHFCFFLSLFFSDVAGQVANEDTDEKILPYCDISKKSKKSLGEMEQEFLEALQVPNIFTTWRIQYTTVCFTALLVLWLH